MRKRALLLGLTISAVLLTVVPASSSPAPHRTTPLDKLEPALLSQGARLWLTGSPLQPGEHRAQTRARFGTNVNANDPSRDLAGGQSETAIAAGGHRVLAAWNDISGALVQPTTSRRASVTGVGVSANGGRSFTDLIGLPNNNPNQQWFGDPTVVAVDNGRAFIIGSLYFPNSNPASINCARPARFNLAVSVARVATNGRVTFTNPIVAVPGGNSCDLERPTPPPNLALLDKEWLSYDPASRTLAMSYTRFFLPGTHSGTGQIELVRARVPANPAALSSAAFSRPVIIRPEEPTVANTGAYVATAPGGTAYVAWERNIDTNLGVSGDPYVYIHAAAVGPEAIVPVTDRPAGPRILTRIVTKGQANSSPAGGVRSLDGAIISGYNRGPGQDFPRIAVDARRRAVIVVWNDASLHPLGDVFLRAFSLTLDHPSRIQKVNDDNSYALHFMPAVSVRADGSIVSSWYDRRRSGANSATTDYMGEIRHRPTSPGRDFRISTGPTDWTKDSSLITPNFGDYTDNASSGTRTWFTWSDGRLGVPQPFVDAR
jgi:hypothetical protein